jgi:subtilisin family serine protease
VREQLPLLWKTLAVAALGVVASTMTCGHDGHERTVTDPASGPLTAIHIKYRVGHVAMAAIDGHAPRPLFSSMRASMRSNRAAENDPRSQWVRVEVPSADAPAVLTRLANDRDVEQAFVPPTVSLPHTDEGRTASTEPSCPIRTPSFESFQGYLGAAPEGINAPAAWNTGAMGQGVWFADLEGGWNAQHEDLPGERITHVTGEQIDRYWEMHGTAVLGEVVGLPNGKGVVGIAPETERVFTSSIGGVPVAEALDAAAEQLRPGDVLLIELQGTGPRGRFLPIEFWDDNFDAIQAATKRGVIVIEAAGNGGENLDHASYRGKLSRKGRDSGAIVVGAGGPPRDGFSDRERLDFSNYGSRVDVQGWGRMVATLDYGDLQACAGTDRHYTGQFAGTSSASPIVAGAAILVQSAAKQWGKNPLPPAKMRELLRATGTPQAGNTREAIGPRPDVARALDAIQPR